MAIIYPDNPITKTAGERHLLEVLQKSLSDAWNIYYEPTLDHFHPDIILYSPYYGVLIIEVKDWVEKTIKYISTDIWTINTEDGEKNVSSPLKQVNEYCYMLINSFSQSKNLIQQDGKYRGRLSFPVGYMCFFSKLSYSYLENMKITSVIPEKFILSLDDSENMLEDKMISILHNLFQIEPHSEEVSSEIKQMLFPEHIISVRDENFFDNKKVRSFPSFVDELLFICTEIRDLQKNMRLQKIAIYYDVDRTLKKRKISEEIKMILADMGVYLADQGGNAWLLSLSEDANHLVQYEAVFIVDCKNIQLDEKKGEFLETSFKKTSNGNVYFTSHD
jgi:hypothetical protein